MDSPAKATRIRKSPAPKTAPGQVRMPGEDHRTRVGRERRERMRRHLLQAVTSVCSGRKITGPAVIEDVVQYANVSRGTFYKYFDSLEEAISQLAFEMVDEMVISSSEYYGRLTDPVQRTATGFQAYLARSIIDRDWGGFVTHLDLFSKDDVRILNNIRHDIETGIKTGDYFVRSVDVAVDLVIGATIEAIRRIVADNRGVDYMTAMTELVLNALGVSHSKAEKVVRQAYDRLRELGPGSLPWWRPLE